MDPDSPRGEVAPLSHARLKELLSTFVGARGTASIAIINRPGGAPNSCWIPDSEREPAFLAYSVTKTIIAVLLMQLREAGRIQLEDPLARWYPNIPDATRISLRQLLNHTAGIPDYGSVRAYHDQVSTSPSTPWSFEQYADATFNRGLLFPPGTGWAYSNPGYMLLKHIAETVAGESLRTLVAERIAQPLGLRRTFVAESVSDLAELAPATSTALSPDGAPRDVRAHYHPGWVSHGVVASTASDLVGFIDGLVRGALISASSLTGMTTLTPVPASGPSAYREPSYGLGLMGDPRSPWGRIVGHNGGGPGYGASVFHAAELGGATVCVMGAIEEGFSAEQLVFAAFDQLASGDAD